MSYREENEMSFHEMPFEKYNNTCLCELILSDVCVCVPACVFVCVFFVIVSIFLS